MKVETLEDAMEAFHVTREQLAKCQANLDGPSGKWYYLVDSANTPGVQYCVAYNRQYKALQCLPWKNGPLCKAADAGFGCWHKRAAAALHVLYRAEMRKIREMEVSKALAARGAEETSQQALLAMLVGRGYDSETAMRIAYANPPLTLSIEEYEKVLEGVNWPDNRRK